MRNATLFVGVRCPQRAEIGRNRASGSSTHRADNGGDPSALHKAEAEIRASLPAGESTFDAGWSRDQLGSTIQKRREHVGVRPAVPPREGVIQYPFTRVGSQT